MKLVRSAVVGCAAAVLASACTTLPSPPNGALPAPPPVVAAGQDVPERLTLEAALRLADAHNPEIRSARAAIAEAEGLRREAGLYPNPQLRAVQDDLWLGRSETGDSKTAMSLGQPVIIGQRRSAATRAAAWNTQAVRHACEATRHRVLTEVHQLFLERLYLEAASQLQWELVGRAQEFEQAARQARDAGRITSADAQKAQLLAEETMQEILRLSTGKVMATRRLRGLLGGVEISDAPVEGALLRDMDWSFQETFRFDAVEEHPSVQAAGARAQAARAQLAQRRAEVVPDVTVLLGGGYAGAREESFAMAGFSVPIPLFDRNQGAIDAAEAAVEARDAEWSGAYAALQAEITSLEPLLTEVDTLVDDYRDSLVPLAQEAYRKQLVEFRSGDLRFLDLLQALDQLVETEQQSLAYVLQLNELAARIQHFYSYFPRAEGGVTRNVPGGLPPRPTPAEAPSAPASMPE